MRRSFNARYTLLYIIADRINAAYIITFSMKGLANIVNAPIANILTPNDPYTNPNPKLGNRLYKSNTLRVMPITKLDAIMPYIKESIMFIYIILKYFI